MYQWIISNGTTHIPIQYKSDNLTVIEILLQIVRRFWYCRQKVVLVDDARVAVN